ncbi:hypothetical protein A2856_01740 [Candidatus Uhrbacteria bacterium RIFCSPHIGHO2_01_FULL_63_20]|uniref:Uncharacterized protein n=1 Tax=Candidatus Uhrbacteria bacterium RIFCSPHIGHO2_01_FULL_63_20 TaxID=1802385 RepID=A0A1F7TK89_9BACT|nr:MAG: hypothetical protein A2856_01740 [Candidatus Uhrbacteria bacterium RIFCSPHIGHO2_01_FULL_63_20]
MPGTLDNGAPRAPKKKSESKRLCPVPRSSAPNGSPIMLVRSRRVATSLDGHYAATVTEEGGGLYLRHSASALAPVPMADASIILVHPDAVMAHAQLHDWAGIVRLTTDGIERLAELPVFSGVVASPSGPFVHGQVTESRRRIVLPDFHAVDDQMEFVRGVGEWRPLETVLTALPDGKLLSVRRRDGTWERAVYGDGPADVLPLGNDPAVYWLPLAEGVTIRDRGVSYLLEGPGGFVERDGAIEMAWLASDLSHALLLESPPTQASAVSPWSGPKRRLLRLSDDGTIDVIHHGRFCMRLTDVWWSRHACVAAALVRYEDGLGRRTGREVLLSASPARTFAPDVSMDECLVASDGTVAAYVARWSGRCSVFVGRREYGPYDHAWNLSVDMDQVVFNAMDGGDVQRVTAT